MDKTVKSGKKLRSDLNTMISSMKAIEESGLTPEAFLVLVHSLCKPDKNGNATSMATVQRVMEAFFSLPEFLK